MKFKTKKVSNQKNLAPLYHEIQNKKISNQKKLAPLYHEIATKKSQIITTLYNLMTGKQKFR